MSSSLLTCLTGLVYDYCDIVSIGFHVSKFLIFLNITENIFIRYLASTFTSVLERAVNFRKFSGEKREEHINFMFPL